jgi:hypothetical protein
MSNFEFRRIFTLFGFLAVLASTAVGCGGKSHPDEDDEPGLYDDMMAELTGRPRYDSLHTYNEDFSGSISLAGKEPAEISIKIMSAPYAKNASIKGHNINLDLVAEFDFGGGPIALTGEATHSNWMRASETIHALKSRQFILLSPHPVFASDYVFGKGHKPVDEVQARLDAFLDQFDSESDGECTLLRIIAERHGSSLKGLIRATYFPKSGGGQGWSRDVGTWSVDKIGDANAAAVDQMTISGDHFEFSKKSEGNISWIQATLVD